MKGMRVRTILPYFYFDLISDIRVLDRILVNKRKKCSTKSFPWKIIEIYRDPNEILALQTSKCNPT